MPATPVIGLPLHETNCSSIQGVQLRYNYWAYPDAAQRRALARAFGCARVVWNDCLRDREEAHAAGLPYVTSAELSRRRITRAKRTAERAWLAEVSAVVLQQSLRDLDTAYKNFFDSLKGKRQGRKVGPPRYKSKKDTRQSIRLNTNAFSLHNDGTVYVAKVGNLKVKWSRRLPAAPTSLTVTKDSCGRCFLSFVVDTEPDILPETEAESGIDLGLSAFAVLSDGRKIDSPRFLRGRRRSSGVFSGSCPARPGDRRTGPRPASKSHASTPGWPTGAGTSTTRHPHRSFATTKRCMWKTSRCPVSAHPARQVGARRGMVRVRGMLEYKAVKHGRTFARVDRAFPSSQVCSACGFRDGPKPLHVRKWTCRACGTVHDRDHNAARNVLREGRRLLAAGRAETPNACGAPVRRAPVPAQRGEAGSPRKGLTTQAGIPGLQARRHVKVTHCSATSDRRAPR